MRAIIVDIDGTLADIRHRRHYVASKPKNWKAFNAAMHLDGLNGDVAWVVRALWMYDTPRASRKQTVGPGHGYTVTEPVRVEPVRVILASGRSEDHRQVTTDWLGKHMILPEVTDPDYVYPDYPLFTYDRLYMRPTGDMRSDVVVKREILDRIRADGYDPFMAVDDRSGVVKMWREAGLRCFQVDEGDF